MKKNLEIMILVMAIVVILALTLALRHSRNKNESLAAALTATQTNHPPAVSTTNAPPSASNTVAAATVVAQTNAPSPSQIDLLAAEVKALKAANEEREARVQRLLKLNEEVRRERATNTVTVTVPVTVIITNSPPSALQVPSKESKKGGAVLMEKAQKPKTRAPMYVVTNTTSSVTTTGTNVTSVVNTQTQSFLKPQRRWSVMGLVFGEKDPIPTTVPSGQSVQQGYPAPQVTVVESPYGYGYPYGYGGYRSPYQPVYSGYSSCERRLFGVRFHAR